MSAYIVVHATVLDPAKMQEYAAVAGPTVSSHGGEVVCRGPCEMISGEFVGELSFISGDVVSADVICAVPTELMAWERDALEPLFKRQGLYKSYVHSLCSVDIAHKLRRMTAVHAGNG
jgi:CRP-like cAMP-binding protein